VVGECFGQVGGLLFNYGGGLFFLMAFLIVFFQGLSDEDSC
jgi:hypothetical protein